MKREEKENSVTYGEGNEKSSYIRGRKREINLHPEKEYENLVTSGERKKKSSYIREKKGN